ncbi:MULTISPECIES: reverse transcriptase domain-containing protein [Enterobacter]|uniref:reverse transcriptase domain-containing protein n=1 Tax=Enterobacter TaxID=547 RepID=UPI001E5E4C0D|nr:MULTISPECIES: reverse transcriptase domain-containing protein [Enterobacter]MCE1613496.1 hypothetical protein [Enterobacter ludwigii]MCE1626797.1 hypothetical protein [Enterobacter ludwigii]GLH27219.1 hypothetical protein ENT52713_46150 [Enterobacter sp. 200527-13]
MTLIDHRPEDGAHARMTQAWQWLCEQRATAPDQADIWHIRWEQLSAGEGWLTKLTHRVLRGDYRLTPLQLHGKNEHRKAVWSAQDALVLKWAALSLQHLLPTTADPDEKKTDAAAASTSGTSDSPDTRHYKWVCRTDIRGYYRNISKQTLINQVSQHVTSPVLRDLVAQYVHYTVEDGGTFHTPQTGISRGCPLSPLMGALHLYDMDAHFAKQQNIHYARYMDDVIILAKTCWSLRKHTKRLMQWFSEYGFEAHPDKTQIGRVQKGFDWMGAWLTHEGVTDVAPRAKANHREKVRRLYEQLARLPKWKRKSATPKVHARVSAYRKRWYIWSQLLLACAGSITSVTAVADRDIVVLSGSLPAAGATLPGGDFDISWDSPYVSIDADTSYSSPGSTIAGLSGTNATQPVGSTSGGVKWGVPIDNHPGEYGIKTDTNLFLKLKGSYRVCDSQSLDYIGGTCLYPVPRSTTALRYAYAELNLDASRSTLCASTATVTTAGGSNGYLWRGGASVPNNAICALGLPSSGSGSSSYGSGATAGTITMTPIAGNGVMAGATHITSLLAWYKNLPAVVLPKPLNIIIAGLTCTVAQTAPGTARDFGNASTDSPVNTLISSLSASDLGVTISCIGANTGGGGPTTLGYTLSPSGGGTVVGGTQLTTTAQPSFYMLFSKNNTAGCLPSAADKIKLDGRTSVQVASVPPGASQSDINIPISASLCSTGVGTQPAGVYTMAATLSLVSY